MCGKSPRQRIRHTEAPHSLCCLSWMLPLIPLLALILAFGSGKHLHTYAIPPLSDPYCVHNYVIYHSDVNPQLLAEFWVKLYLYLPVLFMMAADVWSIHPSECGGWRAWRNLSRVVLSFLLWLTKLSAWEPVFSSLTQWPRRVGTCDLPFSRVRAMAGYNTRCTESSIDYCYQGQLPGHRCRNRGGWGGYSPPIFLGRIVLHYLSHANSKYLVGG